MPPQMILSKLGLTRLMPHIIVLSLIGAGVAILAWVGSLTWTDMTHWGKDIGTIFFGSRTGEAISLGVGMTVLHYFLISMALIGTGTILFLKNRILTAKPQFAMPMKASEVKTATFQTTEKPSEIKTTTKEDTAAAQEERFFSGCLHHFGYLSSRPKDSPIPQECILCQRLGDCMVATVYINKLSE